MKGSTRFPLFFWISLLLVSPCLAQTANVDSAFNLGNSTSDSCVTDTCSNPFVLKTSSSSTHLWMLLPNPWGVTSGTGPGSSVSYGSNGSVVMTVNYTTANSGGVVGSPFVLYGTDQWNSATGMNNSQGPTFPLQLSSTSVLTLDAAYTLTNTHAPANQDVGYDEWLVPSNGYTGGSGGAFEVFIMPYEHFGGTCTGGGSTLISTFNVNTTVNGTTSPVQWKEYAWGKGPGNEIIFCPSNGGYSSGEVSFNAMDFFNKAIADCGTGSGGTVTSSWWVAGIEFASEWGGSSSNINYSLTATKLDIQVGTANTPAPPTGLTATVQ